MINIVDIGCGKSKIDGAIGIDILKDSDADIVCDICKGIPLPDGCVNTAYFREVIEHLHNPIDALKEISRILNNDGLLVLSTPNAMQIRFIMRWIYSGKKDCSKEHIFLWSKPELENLLLLANLKVIEYDFVTYSRYHKNFFIEKCLSSLGLKRLSDHSIVAYCRKI